MGQASHWQRVEGHKIDCFYPQSPTTSPVASCTVSPIASPIVTHRWLERLLLWPGSLVDPYRQTLPHWTPLWWLAPLAMLAPWDKSPTSPPPWLWEVCDVNARAISTTSISIRAGRAASISLIRSPTSGSMVGSLGTYSLCSLGELAPHWPLQHPPSLL